MPENTQKLLQQGIAAAKGKEYALARQLLFQVTILDETNVTAWLWLSSVMERRSEKVYCLNTVLTLDPGNQAAQAGLAKLKPHYKVTLPKKETPRLRPAAAPQAAPPPPASPPETVPLPDLARPQKQQSANDQPVCPFCRQPTSSFDTTCPHCRVPLVMDCPACNTLMDVEWSTCKECGEPLGDYRFGSVYFSQMATGYQKYDRHKKALEALLIARKMNPNQPDLYRHLGEVQAELGRINEAIVTFRKAIEQEPEQAGTYLSLGRALQHEGQWEEAEKVYKQAMKVFPKSSAPYYAMGDLLILRGQEGKARQYMHRAVRIDPRHGLAWFKLGVLYERAHKTGPAVKAYRQALSTLAPDLPEVEDIRARLKYLDPDNPIDEQNLTEPPQELTDQLLTSGSALFNKLVKNIDKYLTKG